MESVKLSRFSNSSCILLLTVKKIFYDKHNRLNKPRKDR